MSVARCLEINARLRAAGITVREWAGWESRGNGQTSAYEGALVHHTGSAYGFAYQTLVTGRPDLSGPLCNYATNEDGSITIIAAHPANHAGASGGRSMGPLPVTTLFNKRALGNEIVYPGTSPMRDAQFWSAVKWARIATDVVGYSDIERGRAHAETSITGKWDPGFAPGQTINMAAFRAAAVIVQPNPEDDMFNDNDRTALGWLAHRVKSIALLEPRTAGNPPIGVTPEDIPLVTRFLALEATVAELKARPPADVDESALAAALAPILAPLIHAGATPEQVQAAVRGVFADAGQA